MLTRLSRLLALELAPFEGRFASSWRVALVCSLTALVFMTWQLPLVAIACYLVLFVMKPDPSETTLMAIGITVLVSLVVGVLVFLVRLSIDIPVWRLVIIALGSFFFLFIGAASKLGPAGGIIALVIAFIMTLLGYVPVGELATRGILYAWLMTLVPMALIIVTTAFWGRSVPRLLRRALALRLRTVALVMQGDTPLRALRPLLREGNEVLEHYALFIRLFHLLPTRSQEQLNAVMGRSYELMIVLAKPDHWPQSQPYWCHLPQAHDVARHCHALADALQDGRALDLALPVLEPVWKPVARVLEQLNQAEPVLIKSPPSGFFFSDAFSNPLYQRFALKTTLAALIAYIIYTALDWQDIHTALVTCYVAALGSTGETVHKLVLRISGCLVGAALGFLSILFVIPHITSIAALMVLVFSGGLIAAWVASGSERSSYAGVQIGLAFFMTVLQGFGPDVQFSVASDRIAGILLGNAIMYVVFTRIWPVSVYDSVSAGLQRVLNDLSWFATHYTEQQTTMSPVCTSGQMAQRIATLNALGEQLDRAPFEPRSLRKDHLRLVQMRRLLLRTERLCLQFALPQPLGRDSDVSPHQEVERLQSLVSRPAA